MRSLETVFFKGLHSLGFTFSQVYQYAKKGIWEQTVKTFYSMQAAANGRILMRFSSELIIYLSILEIYSFKWCERN